MKCMSDIKSRDSCWWNELDLYFLYKFPSFHFQWYKFKSPFTPTLVPQRVFNCIVTIGETSSEAYTFLFIREILRWTTNTVACTKYWTLRIPCTFAAASLWAWILRAATTTDEFQNVVRGQWNTFRDCHWCERLSRHVLLPAKVLWVYVWHIITIQRLPDDCLVMRSLYVLLERLSCWRYRTEFWCWSDSFSLLFSPNQKTCLRQRFRVRIAVTSRGELGRLPHGLFMWRI